MFLNLAKQEQTLGFVKNFFSLTKRKRYYLGKKELTYITQTSTNLTKLYRIFTVNTYSQRVLKITFQAKHQLFFHIYEQQFDI